MRAFSSELQMGTSLYGSNDPTDSVKPLQEQGFSMFCSCDLDLDTMTFIYELDHISFRYTGCAKMNFVRRGFQKLSYYRRKGRQA